MPIKAAMVSVNMKASSTCRTPKRAKSTPSPVSASPDTLPTRSSLRSLLCVLMYF